MNETQTTEAQLPHQPVAKKEQWRWFVITLLGVLIGGVIGYLALWLSVYILPKGWSPYTDLYRTVRQVLMSVAVVGAVLAGSRRYWGPMWAYIGLAIVGLPLIWYGLYSLFTVIF